MIVKTLYVFMFPSPGLIVAVGISNLQYVDLNSSRNLFIVGFAFLMGMSLPEWMRNNPGAINTGRSPYLDLGITTN